MKTLKNLTLLFTGLLIISLLACSKGNETSVVGVVIDKTNINRIPNATVFLKKENLDCFSC